MPKKKAAKRRTPKAEMTLKTEIPKGSWLDFQVAVSGDEEFICFLAGKLESAFPVTQVGIFFGKVSRIRISVFFRGEKTIPIARVIKQTIRSVCFDCFDKIEMKGQAVLFTKR